MRKDTMASIDNKICEMVDDNYYEWYKFFHNAGVTNRVEIAEYYVQEIGKKFNQKSKIQDVFEKIYNNEELELNAADQYFRKSEEFKIAQRKNTYENEIISKETYIQRNIFNNRSCYKNELGDIFGYEVTFLRKKRYAPVDLISSNFDGENLTLNLIELKSCKAKTIKSPARDLLLRTFFEVATYKAYFKKALTHDDELAKAIEEQLKELQGYDKITIEKIKNAKINLTILAPDYIINEKDAELMKGFLKPEIHLLTISPTKEFSEKSTVKQIGKLFNIE